MQKWTIAKRLFAPAALAAAVLAVASTGFAEDAAKPSTGTASITVKVTTADGAAAPGVDVMVLPAAAKKEKKTDGGGTEAPKKDKKHANVTKTDSDGVAKFENLAAGSYAVVAKNKEAGLMGRETVTLSDGGSETVNIKLETKAAGGAGEKKKKE